MIKKISKNSIWLLSLVSLAGGLTSCTDKVDDFMSDPDALHVEVMDASDSISTRTAYSGFHTDFEEGDAIGVYAFNGSSYVSSNIKFTKQADGSWLPDSKVVYNPSYTYYAYFPYISSPYTPSTSSGDEDTKFSNFISDNSNYFWKTDQSTKANYDASNLMITTGVLHSDRTVKFSMKHKRGLAIIGDAVNQWYYSTDTETKYSMTPVFSGNIPYNYESKNYFLVKPNTTTSVAGLSLKITAGKYMVSDGVQITGTPSYTYSLSTDQGSNWGSFSSSKPSWLTIEKVDDDPNPAMFSVTPTATKTTSISVGPAMIRTVAGDATLKAASSVSDVDLSMVNNDGSSRSSRTTANCYLVHAPGTYKIPLVYGNAIKDGAGNESAYHTTQTSNTLQNLVNHADAAIYTGNSSSDPWIKNHSISVDGASLIWTDVKGMVSSVGVSGDYLTFTIDPDNIAEGNAVLAATSGGTVVWSWHIWVTPRTLSESELTTVATGSHDYKVAPVNVGQIEGTITTGHTYAGSLCKVRATANGSTLEFQIKQPDCDYADGSTYHNPSPYFQFGRKDAELPCTGGYVMDGTGFTFSYQQSAVSIGTTIQNPGIHYYNNSNNGPYNENKYNYWDINNTSTSSSRYVATAKTVYDPCPPGFCVPTSGLYYYMGMNISSTTWYSPNTGWNNGAGLLWTKDSPNLFFPASGYRNSNKALLEYVGSDGYNWSATPSNSNWGYYLRFHLRNMYEATISRSSGLPVRPVLSE